MKKYICKIKINNEKGTGFFCKIPFPDKNNMLPVFITNNHVINKLNGKIVIYIEEECNEREIIINNDRMIYMSDEQKYDITIVEIKEEYNIQHYLELDDNIINDILNNDINNKAAKYIDDTVYIIQYPLAKLSVSYGVIKGVFEDKAYEFQHSCSTRCGSSGSPLLNLDCNKIIGIHKQGTAQCYNIATFLNDPIKEFIEKNIKNKIYNSLNCHINKINIETLLNTESSIQEDISNKMKNKKEIISKKNNLHYNNSLPNLKNKSSKIINLKGVKNKRRHSQDTLENSLLISINKQMPTVSKKHSSSNNISSNNIKIKSFQKNNLQFFKSDVVILINEYAIPNKMKRYDKDKKTKFNYNEINKDYSKQLIKQCKNLFTKSFSDKIFSDDIRKQVEAFKEMNDQINKKINIPIYLDNLDLILKIVGIKIINNSNIKLI